jgi:hypothetical protein
MMGGQSDWCSEPCWLRDGLCVDHPEAMSDASLGPGAPTSIGVWVPNVK